MIQLKFRSSVDGAVREIDTVASSLSDLTFPLEQWNKYKRREVQRRFDAGGPGWPDKAGGKMGPPTATEASAQSEKVKQVADELLRTKLRAELRRAQRKYARGRGNAKTMERRYAVLKEFERVAAGGELRLGDTADARLDKSVRGLRDRHARASSKAKSRPLGRVAASIKSKVQKYSVEVYSNIPWAGAHNEGDTVGHGAKLPKREFLTLSDEDVSVLLMMITLYVQSRG